MAKPFVKWAGGKGQLLNTFDHLIPTALGTDKIDTYIEPFVGGGAMLFHVLQNYPIKHAYINDINKELINCYRCLQTDVTQVIDSLQKIEQQYLCANDRKAYYEQVRTRYNEIQLNGHCDFEKCADFIFLNHTCFNGPYRVNLDGKFNVPFANPRKPLICDRDNLLACSQLLQKVTITCGDYADVLSNATATTLVYFDPPYRPLVANNSFTSYDKTGFTDRDQQRLATDYRQLDQKHCWLMLSNSDPKNTDTNDNFLDDLYQGFIIDRVYAKRMINCQGDKRGNITEIVVRNYQNKRSNND